MPRWYFWNEPRSRSMMLQVSGWAVDSDSAQDGHIHVNLYIYIFLFSWGGVRPSSLCTSATNWPVVLAPYVRWRWMWSSLWNENWQETSKYSEKTCLSVTLPTTNPTWPDLGSKPGRSGGKPATISLSYGTAFDVIITTSHCNILVSCYTG
jgi:hypothetical protein